MLRAIFCKVGNAVWISHLDLMRVLQRAFRRGGMMLKHSQGFTPHPCLSIAMPMSVGVSSAYELMDFALAQEDLTPLCEIKDRLNASLPEGIRIVDCYEDGRKLKELQYLQAELKFEYDNKVPQGCTKRIQNLFSQPSVTVIKHGKNGPSEVDIIPMLYSIQVEENDANTLTLHCRVSAQNPTLNPLLLVDAVRKYLPQDSPDFSKCHRVCLYDKQQQEFR